jgi:crotonobetainyl-CoA:carnitine CoA-transferase CaiB-like acyl-CoA transferase
MAVTYDHPEVGRLTLMGQPLRFSESPVPDAGPPPTLGQHTGAILREAGYAEADIADLGRRRVVAGKDLPAR